MAKPAGLAKEQLRVLARLSRAPALSGFYLAGGGAIAFHLGHRRSLDLDLFSFSRDVDLDEARAEVQAVEPGASVVGETDAALTLLVLGEPVELVRYPYPLLEPPAPGPSGIAVAGITDLAVMKLVAIARRGIRRDFWDLYAILVGTGLDLRAVADAYLRRFGPAASDTYHVARALTYFADAEKDPAFPAGLSRQRWTRIKAFFTEQAPALLRE